MTQTLIEIIRFAFAQVHFPGAQHRSLYQVEAWDNYEKWDQSQDHHGSWEGIPEQHFEDCQYSVPVLSECGETQ
jgi:hypothetical protein